MVYLGSQVIDGLIVPPCIPRDLLCSMQSVHCMARTYRMYPLFHHLQARGLVAYRTSGLGYGAAISWYVCYGGELLPRLMFGRLGNNAGYNPYHRRLYQQTLSLEQGHNAKRHPVRDK